MHANFKMAEGLTEEMDKTDKTALFSYETTPNETTRKLIRSETRKKENVWSSLQPVLDVDSCKIRLQFLQSSTSGVKKKDVLHGLLELLCHLCMETVETPSQYKGYITFQHAFEIFSGHLSHQTDKDTFKQHLLHPVHGLPVYIIALPFSPNRIITLKTSFVNVPELVNLLLDCNLSSNTEEEKESLPPDTVKNLLDSIDTEWDKDCCKLLFTHGKKNSEIVKYGIGVEYLKARNDVVLQKVEAISSTNEAARDMVNLRLRDKIQTLEKTVREKTNLYEQKKNSWPVHVLDNLMEEVDVIKERIVNTKEIQVCLENYVIVLYFLKYLKVLLVKYNLFFSQNCKSKTSQQKYSQAVKRTADQLVESNRIKRRNLGAGAHRLIDSDDEEAIAKSIEEKATYHGRRHNTVMYTNRYTFQY